jgi:preprotein translocase subunit SecE
MKFFDYIKETKTEMTHVSWPTKKQALAYTILVLVISILISAYLGLFDFLFTEGVAFLIKK